MNNSNAVAQDLSDIEMQQLDLAGQPQNGQIQQQEQQIPRGDLALLGLLTVVPAMAAMLINSNPYSKQNNSNLDLNNPNITDYSNNTTNFTENFSNFTLPINPTNITATGHVRNLVEYPASGISLQ